MASILDKYGIKEVADLTFYTINSDGTAGVPVLYIDTAKVSTIEMTAENVSARGGKGNPELISWDYGKEITLNIEDALFSAKSMAIMFGANADAAGNPTFASPSTIKKTVPMSAIKDGKVKVLENEISVPTDAVYYTAAGATTTAGATDTAAPVYCTFDMTITGSSVEVSSDTFPGTYYVTGDTYARSEKTGKDEFFQFIVPKAKMNSEQTLTLEAEGDPTVFSMSMKVLRPEDKVMMRLVKYDIAAD